MIDEETLIDLVSFELIKRIQVKMYHITSIDIILTNDMSTVVVRAQTDLDRMLLIKEADVLICLNLQDVQIQKKEKVSKMRLNT